MYCVGNMVGSQIFKSQDAPTYTPGVIGCCICFGLELLIIAGTLLVISFLRREEGLTDLVFQLGVPFSFSAIAAVTVRKRPTVSPTRSASVSGRSTARRTSRTSRIPT